MTALGGATITFAAPASGASGDARWPQSRDDGCGRAGERDGDGERHARRAYSVTASAPGAASATFSLTNTAPTIALAPATLPDGVKGIAYPPTDDHGSGGAVPYTFAVTAGALPGGLSLTTTGALERHADRGGHLHLHGDGDGRQ